MYQALYRKYRPQTLDEISGQKTIVTIIKNSIKNGQISHAYLFSGPRGTGKTSIAKIFAKIVNCQNLDGYTPCGNCVSCTQTNNSDILEIDAASNNGVDEIRELRNKVNLVPSYGKYKVYIIDEVHMLTVGAFNALLKTLEEPPTHAIFILATTDPQKVPETILSRCQRLDFKKISINEIVENLSKISRKENIEIDKEALTEIARLSDGGMRDSIGLLDQARAYTEGKITLEDIHNINGTLTEQDLQELLDELIENKLSEILEKSDKYNEQGKNFSKLIEEFINFIRNIILYKKVPEYFKTLEKDTKIYKSIADKIDNKSLLKYIETLNKYSFEMKNTNNQKLMFELAIIEILTEKEEEAVINNTMTKEKVQETKEDIIPTKPAVPKTEIVEEKEGKQEQKTIAEKPEELLEKLKNLKKLRIDNTLSKFNKRKLIEVKSNLEKLTDLLLNPDYSHAASIILDGILKASSEENMIFVYKSERTANLFNENLIEIEAAIEKALGTKYNLIATDIDDWNIIKDDFNHKKRAFVYKEEKEKLEDIFVPQKDGITSMFEDIIVYK